MNRSIRGAALASALVAAPAVAQGLPAELAPPPPPPATPRPPTRVPAGHWSRPLLGRLEFPGDRPRPRLASDSRLDAAIHLARWLERGRPSPAARPRLLAGEYAEDLRTLGLSPARITAALERLEPAAPVLASPPGGGAHGERARRLVEESLTELRSIEARLRRLEARRR